MNTETKQTEQTEQTDRDEKGQYIPGNQYLSLNAFKQGSRPDRPNKWTILELRDIMIDYLQTCLDNRLPIIKSGLQLELGISREAMDNYSKGEYGKTEEERQAYAALFRQFYTVIESELETELRRDKGQVNGIIFALKNQFHNSWRDEKHISVNNETRTIQIIVGPDSALTQRLEQAARDDNIQFIEHTGEGGE